MAYNDDIERARQKSVTPQKKKNILQYTAKVTLGHQIKIILITAATSMLLVTTLYEIPKIADSINVGNMIVKNDKAIVQMVEPYSNYGDIVDLNTHLTSDRKAIWYNNYDIASNIISILSEECPESLDCCIYSAYRNMEWNRTDNMNELINSLARRIDKGSIFYLRVQDCSSFKEYLINNNFFYINDNGEVEPDIDKWIEYCKLCQDIFNNYCSGMAKEGTK